MKSRYVLATAAGLASLAAGAGVAAAQSDDGTSTDIVTPTTTVDDGATDDTTSDDTTTEDTTTDDTTPTASKSPRSRASGGGASAMSQACQARDRSQVDPQLPLREVLPIPLRVAGS